MTISYSAYFKVIALPVLVFAGAAFICLIVGIIQMIKKKKRGFQKVLLSVLTVVFIFIAARAQLIPAARLLLDAGAQRCFAEGTITGKEMDRTYEHNRYTGWYVVIKSEKYYIFDDGQLYKGQQVKIEYLPHSRMIVNWEPEEVR